MSGDFAEKPALSALFFPCCVLPRPGSGLLSPSVPERQVKGRLGRGRPDKRLRPFGPAERETRRKSGPIKAPRPIKRRGRAKDPCRPKAEAGSKALPPGGESGAQGVPDPALQFPLQQFEVGVRPPGVEVGVPLVQPGVKALPEELVVLVKGGLLHAEHPQHPL